MFEEVGSVQSETNSESHWSAVKNPQALWSKEFIKIGRNRLFNKYSLTDAK